MPALFEPYLQKKKYHSLQLQESFITHQVFQLKLYKSAFLLYPNTQSADKTECNQSLWYWPECFYEPVTNPYALYISPTGECATVLGQSKNCSSLQGIKASLKSINDFQTSVWILRLFVILKNQRIWPIQNMLLYR